MFQTQLRTQFHKKYLLNLAVFFAIFSLLNLTPFCTPYQCNEALAATNLISGGSFENNISDYWGIWQREGSERTYELYRAYDSPFGYGSYSAAIDALGSPEEPFSAVLSSKVGKNKFAIETGSNYFLVFHAKASQNLDIITYLERADDYSAITLFEARNITTDWQKYIITFSPTVSTNSLLAFVFGDMPAGATLFLDGVQLLKDDFTIGTAEVKGYIGDTDKYIKISGIANFNLEDIEIEVPYFDNAAGIITTLRSNPERMSANGVYFDLNIGTFAGIGRVYISGGYVGEFNYNILTKITEFHPAVIRADSDVVVMGSGFIPDQTRTFLVLNKINNEHGVEQVWVPYNTIDSNLTQMSFQLPDGVVSGKMYAQTSFIQTNGEEKINKSSSLSYKLKPIIYATDWSQRGYEQVGDKLLIYGKGFGRSPSVVFYNNAGKKVDTKKASLLEAADTELIEVATTNKTNSFTIVVLSEGVESDQSGFLSFLAKPKFSLIKSKYNRTMNGSQEKIPAAKVGEEITLSGEGFKPNADSFTAVEFQGLYERILVTVNEEKIDQNGKWVKVIVPNMAQNGYLNVIVNGQGSNYHPIEIIPTVTEIFPQPTIIPGETMIVSGYGIGDNINLAKIHFNLGNNNKISVTPYAIDASETEVDVYFTAPLAMSSQYTSINLQYDRWQDNGDSVLNVNPNITSASINMDNKILTIRGYGFSIKPKENVITYMYADEGQTVINPKVKMLGVYPTEDGQEIRIKILDDYYFGYVTVTVGDLTSNEANFGPINIHNIARRIEYVESVGQVMGVLYISGYNFGPEGGVLVGDHWADVHYRSNFFIIAVIDQAYVYDNPVIVARP